MNFQQLCHAIRAACTIANSTGVRVDSVIIVGSQSILGTYRDASELPPEATRTLEVDLMANIDDENTLVFLSDAIEGVAGELSLFEETHGFSIDGVDTSTSVLPAGWRDRLVPVRNADTIDIVTGMQYTGWCLDPADCCVAKIAAGRQKDKDYVFALFHAGLVDPSVVQQRLCEVPDYPADKKSQANAALANHFSDTRNSRRGHLPTNDQSPA